jgi:hypothetical protein
MILSCPLAFEAVHAEDGAHAFIGLKNNAVFWFYKFSEPFVPSMMAVFWFYKFSEPFVPSMMALVAMMLTQGMRKMGHTPRRA